MRNAKALSLVLLAAASLPARALAAAPATAPPDAGLYTSWSIYPPATSLSYTVCGSVPGSDGCYGGGTVTGFGKVGAIIEGEPVVSGTTVTRNVYVVEQAYNGTTVTKLYIYRLVEAINAPMATISFTRVKTITLPCKGGPGAKTFLAATKRYLFIGTDQDPFFVRMSKLDYSTFNFGGFSPPSNVSSMTADAYGYVTVTYGTDNLTTDEFTFGPDGGTVSDGGGADVMVGTTRGVSTFDFPVQTSGGAPAARPLTIHFHKD